MTRSSDTTDRGRSRGTVRRLQMGRQRDLNQIYVTWDAKYLYLAATGVIWNNNMIVLLDTTPGRGLSPCSRSTRGGDTSTFDTTGSSLGTGFAPDLFGATWDNNTSPRLIVSGGRQHGARPDRRARVPRLGVPFSPGAISAARDGVRDPVAAGVPVRRRHRHEGLAHDRGRRHGHAALLPAARRSKIAGVITAGGDFTPAAPTSPPTTSAA